MYLKRWLTKSLTFRCDSLAEVNTMLREQLANANQNSDSYAEELKAAKDDLLTTKEELKGKEAQWKEEQEVDFDVSL